MADNRGTWSGGDAYEPYVGRWSRLVAREFLDWLAVPQRSRWADIGCGTGALTEIVLATQNPASVHGVEPSDGYRAVAEQQVSDPRAHFLHGDAQNLPLEDAAHDAVVSGLVLNFIPDKAAALAHFRRVTRRGGVVAAYVWDYAGRMELMRYFWDAVSDLWPDDASLDEGRRFPICQPDPLRELFTAAGLRAVEAVPLDVPTHFRGFDDYWSPFLGGQFPAPDYAMSLSQEDRQRLRETLRKRLPIDSGGEIQLSARAWGVKGIVH